MAEKILITSQKKTELEAELLERKTIIRPNIGERLQAARALGDLSENAEYHSCRDEQGKNEGRIQQIEAILKHAQIIERSGSGKVELGASVTIKKVADDSEKTYTLVSETEANIENNTISPSSLIGAAMLGKSEGNSFVITTPRGETEYVIVSIS